ncbi:unnamed protein product [Pelagomonas calceolata]|uniref:Uncharacterized protein n=2 Tax=Pelagomonas calceolata TaxID=35677 RepID=A0A8J2SCM8_9STRA|nr:unnamed protein product [Pelagomonas calceolata]
MEVFVVHYDKLEVGRNHCYATDAEVVGVFLQLCNAIRRAREKAVEIRERFDYFAESENPLNNTDENNFWWDGTRPDDVGRTIEDRVYVRQYPTRDQLPTRDMTFEAAEPFLAAMKQGELVAAIGRAWDQSPALRSQLEAATADTWSRAADQRKMLAHNWEEDPKPRYGETGPIRFKDAPATVNVGNLWHGMSMAGVNDLLDGGDLVWEDEDGEEGGCDECGAPGSTCTVILEANRKGTLRLVAETQIMCYCNSDSAEVACTDRATFRIAAPARKTKRKAR